MTISRCSELLAILVEKPLRVTCRNTARPERMRLTYNTGSQFEFAQDSVDVCVLDRPMHVLNTEAMTKCVDFSLSISRVNRGHSASVTVLSLRWFLPFSKLHQEGPGPWALTSKTEPA